METETNKYTIIGIFNHYEYSYLVSLEELFQETKDTRNKYTMKDYSDRRRSTNLQRFNFDPFTGKKIDWNVVKNYK